MERAQVLSMIKNWLDSLDHRGDNLMLGDISTLVDAITTLILANKEN